MADFRQGKKVPWQEQGLTDLSTLRLLSACYASPLVALAPKAGKHMHMYVHTHTQMCIGSELEKKKRNLHGKLLGEKKFKANVFCQN